MIFRLLNIKYNEMINLGFNFIDDPLIPNNYIIFKSYKSITELSTRAESCSCAICHENYENEKDTVYRKSNYCYVKTITAIPQATPSYSQGISYTVASDQVEQ